VTLRPISLWPSEPISAPGTTAPEVRQPLFPSARQGLTYAVEACGGDRRHHISLPEYVGHCVISSVAKHVSPMPISAALQCPKTVAQVLLYSQWGWERSTESLNEVLNAFPDSRILLDRVDSLTSVVEELPDYWSGSESWQVFSMSKTMGLEGGGLVYDGLAWVNPPSTQSEDVEKLLLELDAIRSRLPDGSSLRALVSQWRMSDIDALGPSLTQWLDLNDIECALATAARARSEHLAVVRDHRERLDLTDWMAEQITGEVKALPGILPVPCIDLEQGSQLATEIETQTGVQVVPYHFDYSSSFIVPDWRPVVAVPLHWRVPMDTLDWIIGRCGRNGA